MTTLTATAAAVGSRLGQPWPVERAAAGRRSSATGRTVAALGAIIALAGVEHGVGEIQQGETAPASVVIQSWPNAEAFRVLSGEPAMTVVPNLLATGVLAVLVSACVGVWAVAFAQRRHGGAILVLLSVAMLLVGGGFGPPLIGVGLGAAATRIGRPLTWRRTHLSTGARARLAAAWPWVLAADVAAWLGVVPGAVVAGSWFGADAVPSGLVYALLAAALLLLPLSILAAFARDLEVELCRSGGHLNTPGRSALEGHKASIVPG